VVVTAKKPKEIKLPEITVVGERPKQVLKQKQPKEIVLPDITVIAKRPPKEIPKTTKTELAGKETAGKNPPDLSYLFPKKGGNVVFHSAEQDNTAHPNV